MGATCPAFLILSDLTVRIFGEAYTSYEAPHYAVFSSILLLPPYCV